MRDVRTRMLRAAGAVLAAGALVLAFGAPVNASPGNSGLSEVNISVNTADGVSLSTNHVIAGYITFHISSPEDVYHGVQGFRPLPGHTVADVINDFTLGVGSASKADNAQGALQLQSDADLIGGAVTWGTTPIDVTVPLHAGTYYFFDLGEIFVPIAPRLQVLYVTGAFHYSALPHVTSVIDAHMDGNDPRFSAPSHIDANGNILIYVSGDEVHEAVFRPTRAGIDDAYVSTFYDAVLAGGPRPQSPWTGSQHGLQAMSAGRWAIMHINFPPGDYSLICYVPSDESGNPHGYIGMHKQVVLG